MKTTQIDDKPLKSHPGFHIWFFNHPVFYGIGDQLHFLFKYFQQMGGSVTCGRQPSNQRCNIVIENFDQQAVQHIKTFCQSRGKSISIVLTEHVDIHTKDSLPNYKQLELKSSSIHLHGKSVDEEFSYLPLPVLIQRSNCLLALREVTSNYFRLGDLPEMKGFSYLAHNRKVDTLWFPKLNSAFIDKTEAPSYDFIFLGAKTEFRESVINTLKDFGFTFVPTFNGVSIKQRHIQYKQARFCLNIPQDETWPWLSPMRIISALQAGLPVLSIGTNDTSAISVCTRQVPMVEGMIDTNQIRDMLASHETEALKALIAYEELAATDNTMSISLLNSLNSWALTDGIVL